MEILDYTAQTAKMAYRLKTCNLDPEFIVYEILDIMNFAKIVCEDDM